MKSNNARVLLMVSVCVLLFLCNGLAVYGDTTSQDWQTYHYDNEHSGNATGASLTPPLEIKWTFPSNVQDVNVISAPVIVNGTIYFGTKDNNVYALNATTGSTTWIFPTGGWTVSNPAVDDGVVYIGSYDNNLYALRASDGHELWHYTTGNWVRSGSTLAYGNVYFASWDGYVYAVATSNGSLVWKYYADTDIEAVPAVDAGVVYISHNSVYAIDAYTGTLKWSTDSGSSLFGSSPTVYGGVVFMG